jgi:hypothetical protein
MAIEEDGASMLIGFAIVLIVGLNIVFFFGNIVGSGSPLTGAAIANCQETTEGIGCENQLFVSAHNGICPEDTVKVCTNVCELARVYANDNRVCPTTCINVCVPTNIAEKL